MKNKSRFCIVITLLFLLAGWLPSNPVLAGGSSAQLTDLVAQLQKCPETAWEEGQELREQIIKLVATMPHKPELPEGLDELMGEAKAAVKNAKSPLDYNQGVDAFNQASLLAPWEADIYYNLGVVQEKAEDFERSMNSFTLYLLAKPNAKDKRQVKEKIGSLQYEVKKADLSGWYVYKYTKGGET